MSWKYLLSPAVAIALGAAGLFGMVGAAQAAEVVQPARSAQCPSGYELKAGACVPFAGATPYGRPTSIPFSPNGDYNNRYGYQNQ